MGKAEKTRRVYTKECKAEAIALAEKGEKPVSKSPGIWVSATPYCIGGYKSPGKRKGEGAQQFPRHGRP
jgi:hypothetical protein